MQMALLLWGVDIVSTTLASKCGLVCGKRRAPCVDLIRVLGCRSVVVIHLHPIVIMTRMIGLFGGFKRIPTLQDPEEFVKGVVVNQPVPQETVLVELRHMRTSWLNSRLTNLLSLTLSSFKYGLCKKMMSSTLLGLLGVVEGFPWGGIWFFVPCSSRPKYLFK